MPKPTSADYLKLLDDFATAFDRHDLDALMSMMTEDCVFETAAGSDAFGTRHQGQTAVRAAFALVFAASPDARWRNARHFVSGDHGLSEWTFTATRPDGRRVEVNGCDVFTLRDGRIAVKNAFRKDRPALEV